jgi:hypothetical protein
MTAATIPPLELAPHMPAAACLGDWSTFDDAGAAEHPIDVARRHASALALCRDCPERARCEGWYLGLPKSKRPIGVVAGRINPPAPNAPGRPRKSATA